MKILLLIFISLGFTLPSFAARKKNRRAAAPSCQYEELKLDKALSRSPKTVFTSKSMSLVFMDGDLLKKASAITDLGVAKCEFDFEEFKTAYYSPGNKKIVLQEKSGVTKLMDIESCQMVEEFHFEARVPFEKCRIKKPVQHSSTQNSGANSTRKKHSL